MGEAALDVAVEVARDLPDVGELRGGEGCGLVRVEVFCKVVGHVKVW